MSDHTPAAWYVSPAENAEPKSVVAWVNKPSGEGLAVVAYRRDVASFEAEANARLIAAAPDMLAEIDKQIKWLRHLRAEIDDSIRPSLLMGIDQSIKYLDLVSAKARGETAP